MKFTIYSTQTGKILRNGDCPESIVPLQARKGETVVAEYYDPSTHYFDGGIPVEFPPKPSPYHDFDFSSRQWVGNSVRAWEEIRRRRDILLMASDWITLRAADGGPAAPLAWRQYRQALRDITTQPDPFNIVWPDKPQS